MLGHGAAAGVFVCRVCLTRNGLEWNGAGPDCFRHYEMMVEGNIVLVPDVESLRSFMGGLPVFFLGEACGTCEVFYTREACVMCFKLDPSTVLHNGFHSSMFLRSDRSVKKPVVSIRVELYMNDPDP